MTSKFDNASYHVNLVDDVTESFASFVPIVSFSKTTQFASASSSLSSSPSSTSAPSMSVQREDLNQHKCWTFCWKNCKMFAWLNEAALFSSSLSSQKGFSGEETDQQQQQQSSNPFIQSQQKAQRRKNNTSLKKQLVKSHLFLNGGLATVPPELNEVFNDQYYKALCSNIHCMISEQRTPIYRWCCDWDIKHSRHIIMNVETLLPYIKVMAKAIKCFYSYITSDHQEISEGDSSAMNHDQEKETERMRDVLSVTFEIIVCQTKTRVLESVTGTCKTGFHLYMPNLFINDDIARMFRKTILYRFSKEFSEMEHARLFLEPWAKMFDEQIYIKNGLRMVGSYKTVKCTFCPSSQTVSTTGTSSTTTTSSQFCQKCNSKELLLDPNSVYYAVALLDGFDPSIRLSMREAEMARNPSLLIKETSIRTSRVTPEPEFVQPEDSNQFPLNEIEKFNNACRSLNNSYHGGGGGGQHRSKKPKYDGCSDYMPLEPRDEEFKCIQNIIRSLPHYDQLVPTRINRMIINPTSHDDTQKSAQFSTNIATEVATGLSNVSNKSTTIINYYVHVKGPAHQTRFCQNVNRVHNNATIRFVLSNRFGGGKSSKSQPGIVQKCFCTCPHTDTTSGKPCSEYSSNITLLTEHDIEILFGSIITNPFTKVVDSILTKTPSLTPVSVASVVHPSQESSSTSSAFSNNLSTSSATLTNSSTANIVLKYLTYTEQLMKPVTPADIQNIIFAKQNQLEQHRQKLQEKLLKKRKSASSNKRQKTTVYS